MNHRFPPKWVRATRHYRCPVCEGDSWCTRSPDHSLARCKRVESDRPCPGEDGDAWLHVVAEVAVPYSRRPSRRLPMRDQPRDLSGLMQTYARAMNDDRLAAVSEGLGVPGWVLRSLGIGWAGRALAFPMLDERETVIGIRYRHHSTGAKWSETGGREGLFLPAALSQDDPLLICEGPTDCAAILGLGFSSVGRPSCSGGAKLCAAVARGRDVVICADADGPGRQGAESLAQKLIKSALSVRVVTPPEPYADFRDAVCGGFSGVDMAALVEAQAVGGSQR